MRVEPQGVVSLVDRLADGRKRFNLNRSGNNDMITEAIVNKSIDSLKNFEI